MSTFRISGNIVDVHNQKIKYGTIQVESGKISSIAYQKEADPHCSYIMPGFIDSHVHIESSMLIPSEFARLAVLHGTVGVVSDPHEIANVLGVEGIKYLIENGKNVPFHFKFAIPSSVPVTPFETNGASITLEDMEYLYKEEKLTILGEVMNFPAVLNGDEKMKKILTLAKKYNAKIDGHSPGLRGKDAKAYASAGIETDHECFTYEEAIDKINSGMKIQIREGSAAKNYDALHKLLKNHADKCMFCTDDCHPDDLLLGHINKLVKKSIVEHKYNLFNVLQAASVNPVNHYKLDVGLLREKDSADFIVIDNLKDFNVVATYIKGIKVAENGKSFIENFITPVPAINKFNCTKKTVQDFVIPTNGKKDVRVIEGNHPFCGNLIEKAINKELFTKQKFQKNMKQKNGAFVCDIENDILKIAVVNRYKDAKVAVAFITGFGLKKGALACSIAHDSHNIIAIGTSDEELCKVVNQVIDIRGGVVISDGETMDSIPLPVAGLMTNERGFSIANHYAKLHEKIEKLGSKFPAPLMTLSFMALLVIPELKLSDKGLFDAVNFKFVEVTADS